MEREDNDAHVSFGNRKIDARFCEQLVTALGLDEDDWRTQNDLAKLRASKSDDRGAAFDLWFAASNCRDLAIASLMLDDSLVPAREWLIEAARYAVEAQGRGEQFASNDGLDAVFFLAVAGDRGALRTFCRAYLESPEGIAGEEGPGGVTPHAQDHYWHLMNFVANAHANDAGAGDEALQLLLAQKVRTMSKLSPDWWRAMCAVASASSSGDREKLRTALALLPAINRIFFRPHSEPEAALASRALALATVAVERGCDLRPALDPSLPVELFHFPEVRVPPRRTRDDCREIDELLRDRLLRAAAGDFDDDAAPRAAKKPAAKKPAAKKPAAKKPAAKKPAAKKAATKKAATKKAATKKR